MRALNIPALCLCLALTACAAAQSGPQLAQTWVAWAVRHSHSLGKARTAAYRSPSVAARVAQQALRDRGTALPGHSKRRGSTG